LVEELAQNRVVLLGLEFFSPGGEAAGHALLAVGWDQNDEGQYIIVYDPIRGVGSVLYEDLLSAYGRGGWYCTWTGIGE